MKLADLTVVDHKAPYNAILETPLLYTMRAIPSTYHQCVKLPIPGRVGTIKGRPNSLRNPNY